eukprot:gene16390-34231_t
MSLDAPVRGAGYRPVVQPGGCRASLRLMRFRIGSPEALLLSSPAPATVGIVAWPDNLGLHAEFLLPTFAGLRHKQMAQYVFSMNRVGKIVPPKRQILKDISLSFFPGAKIGVLGTNGSGKSTLLKIMAGLDKEIEGEAIPMP